MIRNAKTLFQIYGSLTKEEILYSWSLIINGMIGLLGMVMPLLLALPSSYYILLFFILPIYGIIIGVLCLKGKVWAFWTSLIFYLVQFFRIQSMKSGFGFVSGLHLDISWHWTDRIVSMNLLAVLLFVFGVYAILKRKRNET